VLEIVGAKGKHTKLCSRKERKKERKKERVVILN
jgi:hypothetical protein